MRQHRLAAQAIHTVVAKKCRAELCHSAKHGAWGSLAAINSDTRWEQRDRRKRSYPSKSYQSYPFVLYVELQNLLLSKTFFHIQNLIINITSTLQLILDHFHSNMNTSKKKKKIRFISSMDEIIFSFWTNTLLTSYGTETMPAYSLDSLLIAGNGLALLFCCLTIFTFSKACILICCSRSLIQNRHPHLSHSATTMLKAADT